MTNAVQPGGEDGLQIRCCRPEEAERIYNLQNEVRAAMPDPSLFVPDTLEHIQSYLEGDLCLGAWDNTRLAGYFILRYCGERGDNYAAFLGKPRSEWKHWANADSVIVHPKYRGRGLQRRMIEAALPLLPPEITALGATISPDNPYSLRNALACGFVVRCRREMYGGYDRYLLEKIL